MLRINEAGEIEFLEGDQFKKDLKGYCVRCVGKISRVLRISRIYIAESRITAHGGSLNIVVTNGLIPLISSSLYSRDLGLYIYSPVAHNYPESGEIYMYNNDLGCWVRVGVEVSGGDTCCICREGER